MGTGKTSLVLRFVKGQFFEFQESTIGAAFFTQVLSLNEATIKFDIWDTAGQERYHSLAPMYYRGAAAAVVVYDITSMESFERAKKWVLELQRQGNPNLIMFLAANKADLEEKRKVASEEGEQYAKESGLVFLETSAKTAQNVNELFYEIGFMNEKTPLKTTNLLRTLFVALHISNYHEGDVMDTEDDDERPLLLTESLPEVPKDLASLKETEHASAGSFFIGVNGGVPGNECGLDGDLRAISSSPEEEPPVSNRDGDESGVSNGVSTLLALLASLSYMGLDI
ncbi:hypothetical protein GH714_024255 [Hevea brasiliensis]|uniref:Uncharacterized protein n=1 Tax=Hevea brasiliensis TaxID=3981 RepID=A0A6A6LR31_HEVBR|nr:hypothetical protein GH714_024255 [Hevea brasiliensis]